MPQDKTRRFQHLVPVGMLGQGFNFSVAVHRPGPNAVTFDLDGPKPGAFGEFSTIGSC